MFYDLGFDEAEARVLEMRADLMGLRSEAVIRYKQDATGAWKFNTMFAQPE